MTVLTFHHFETLMTPFHLKAGDKIAVGVSGGADSLCLTLFLARWAIQKNIRLTALTVNHNLRSEAASEANFVHTLLTKKHITHYTLLNTFPVPATHIEFYARQIRYRLMTDFCKQHNISHLFLAHHLGDQCETFFLRLAKSSGLKGLSGMHLQSEVSGIYLCRPFLTIPKRSLITALQKQKITWIEDEMNQDIQFERVKWRHFLPALESAGIQASALGESMRRLYRADKALDTYTQQFLQKNVWIDYRGFARLPTDLWLQTPTEIQLRIIGSLIRRIGQRDDFLSLKALENLCSELPCDKTLGGCHFKPHKTGLYIFRELREMETQKFFQAGHPFYWDRFFITPFIDGFIHTGVPLKKVANIPVAVQKTFPAVFIQKKLEKITQIDYKEKNDPVIQIEFIGKTKEGTL